MSDLGLKPWKCPVCDNHYFMHGLRNGKPVCPVADPEQVLDATPASQPK
jgi:hypothetical protein